MRRVRVALASAFAGLLFAGQSVFSAWAQPPVEAFGSLPQMSEPALSPDGQYLAAIQGVNGRPALAIYKVGAAEGSAPIVIAPNEWIVLRLKWAKNDRLVYYPGLPHTFVIFDTRVSVTFTRAVAVSPDGRDSTILLGEKPGRPMNLALGEILDVALHDPDHIYLPAGFGNAAGRSYGVFRVNVRDGESERIAGNAYTYQWVMDGAGNLVARVDEAPHGGGDIIRVPDGDAWRDLKTFPEDYSWGPGIVGLTQDGTALVRNAGTRTDGLLRLDLKTGAETQLYADPAFDVMHAIEDEWTGRVVGAVVPREHMEYIYFDANRQRLQRALARTFPNLSVAVVSLSRSLDRAVVMVEGPRKPPTYFLVDRTGGTATEILSSYPGLTEADLGEMRSYPYTARDGLTIPAFLTLPPNRPAKSLPLVVLPHGGPAARDVIGFDWIAQFLANRGYAVLQPNFRGSHGYGHAFTQAGYREWGGKMQDDVSDGVKKAIADGIADPDRICIVGASYGGYAALAGATLTPDLYACAASISGVSDLLDYLKRFGDRYGYGSATMQRLALRIGNYKKDRARLEATSPARLAANVRVPILLMHGESDSTVPISQSRNMEHALLDAGKDVRFVPLPGDDHYMRLAATRITVLRELEAFLAANIGR